MRLRDEQRTALKAQGLSDQEVASVMAQRPVSLPQMTLHRLRHCAASYMWDETGDLLAVSALRHATPAVTAEVYTHMRPGKQRQLFDTNDTVLKTAHCRTHCIRRAKRATSTLPR